MFEQFLLKVDAYRAVASVKKKSEIQNLIVLEEKLSSVAAELKKEFIGLDYQIDQLVNAIRPWYLMPEALRRPSVVTLWGMTGVGKTSLVQSLINRLQLTENFVYEDLGKHVDNVREYSSQTLFARISHLSGTRSILFFDEVQIARTIAEGREVDRPSLRDFWALLDTGYIQMSRQQLSELRVVFSEKYKYYKKNPPQSGERIISSYEIIQAVPFLGLNRDLSNELMELTEEHALPVVQWIVDRLDEFEQKLPVFNFSKSLIILAGNIDEAYGDVRSVDPSDYTTEELFEKLKSVGAPQIKEGLLSRFRAEQVSRMGTSLIVFPSFSSDGYYSLIDKHLSIIEERIRNEFLINIKFDASVREIIYSKGVLPTQGARPVLSTISEIIESRVPLWVLSAAKRELTYCEVLFTPDTNRFDLKSNDEVIYSDVMNVEVKQTRFADSPEILLNYAALHEAGHLVVGVALFGMLPSRVIFGEGVSHKVPPQVRFLNPPVLTKQIAKNLIATGLGGYAAEQIMFGDSGVSSSAMLDLRVSTELASQMISEMGMGAHLGTSLVHPELVHNLRSLSTQDDALKEKWLKEALIVAKKEISKQWEFFKKISYVLKNELQLSHQRLEDIFLETYKASDDVKEKILARKFDKTYESKPKKSA